MILGKMKYTLRSVLVRCLVVLAGIAVTGFGAAAFVTAGLGSDPLTAFVQGMGIQLHMSLGTAMSLFNLAFFVVVLFLDRRTINIGTVLHLLTLGYFCDLFMALLSKGLGSEPAMALRIALLVLGTAALGVGLGFYQSAAFGSGPSDAFNQAVSKKSGIPLKWERVMFDGVMVAGGFLMGGTVFIGTVVGMLSVGPIMAPIITGCAPLVDRWAGTAEKQ